jgi:hypothetical protein
MNELVVTSKDRVNPDPNEAESTKQKVDRGIVLEEALVSWGPMRDAMLARGWMLALIPVTHLKRAQVWRILSPIESACFRWYCTVALDGLTIV